MKRENLSIFAIAGTYVGTVVGAGFATGQEVMRFFTYFGLGGIYAALGATVLFALLGAAVLQIAHRLRATSHREVVSDVVGPFLGRLVDAVLAFFLFISAGIMMAGSGAVFAEHWHAPRLLGTLLMALLSVGTVLLGLRGVVTAISAVAPVLIGMVLLISGWTLTHNGISAQDLATAMPERAASAYWPISLLLYVSYNLVLSVPVLAPLGGMGTDAVRLRWGGLIGGVTLGLGALAINLALLAGLPETARYEVPMLHLAGMLPRGVSVIYGVVLWLEIYTTAVSSLYGLVARYVPEGQPRHSRNFTLAVGLGALLVSQVGFAKMVVTIFPLVGWLGLIFMAAIAWRAWQGVQRREV